MLLHVFQPSLELHPAVLGFIVLSGYCIHRRGFRGSREPLTGYALRRIFRILPIYWVATAFGIFAFEAATAQSGPLAQALNGVSSIKEGCLVAKITTVAALVPFFHPCSYAGNAPLATVMVEITLYATYALSFLLCWAGRGAQIGWICAGAWTGGLVVAGFAPQWPLLYNWWQNSSLLGFLPYWWLGAIFCDPRTQRLARHWGLVLLCAWGSLTAALLTIGSDAILSEIRKLVFAILIGMVIAALDRRAWSAPNPLSGLGVAGYSLYAFHAPLMHLLVLRAIPWWANLACCIALGLTFYFVLERPLTRLGQTLARQQDQKPEGRTRAN